MRDRLFVQLLLAIIVCTIAPTTSFLWDKEVEIVRSEWSAVVVVVRHVEFIGVTDNGTLDCSVPGFTKYRWTIINKATKENYAESYIMGSGDEDIPDSQSKITIGNDGFPLVNDLMVVSCEALVGLHPRMQIIWAITRLHSPLGYPTDPRVCDFGGKDFSTNCTWYQWTYKTDCYYDKGLEYTGSVSYAKDQKKCKYWHMATGIHNESHVLAKYMGIFYKGGHDYCRNVNVNPTCYLKKRQAEPCKNNILTQPWCYSDDNPNEKPLTIHYCKIRECSSCIYGNGNGFFKLYPRRKFPVYLGRGINTVKGDKHKCLQGVGWADNICRTKLSIKTPDMSEPHVVTKATPHCYVGKQPNADSSKVKKVPDDSIELARCKFRQCTVRQVWFLFFNTYGQPFVVESNFKGVKLDLVEGRREERIKFAAFGIHMTEGFQVGANDYSVSNNLGSFELKIRRPPDKLSELIIKNIKKQYKGNYFLQYKFLEADPTVDQSTFKVNFEVDVKEPTTFRFSPPTLRVCLKSNGKLTAKVNGYFSILEDSIKWKYGTSSDTIDKDILPQNTRFELSADAKSLVIKDVTEELWVSVEGRSYSGLTIAAAQVALKEQAFFKAVSPLIQYVLPGDDVTLIVEHDQLQSVTWVFDAMVIASLPDDPNMGFRRVVRGDKLVTSLVITDVRDDHYGDYHVETSLGGCKSVITLAVKHSSENPDFNNVETSNLRKKITVAFNRTGIWCTDELDPYAFYFDIKFDTFSTIGALRNEPLTQSKATEIQHYSIKYSSDKIKWSTLIFDGKSSRIPYTLLGSKIHWLRVPIRGKYLRVYPERLDSVACMKVRLFGCKGDTLDCDDINNKEHVLSIIIGSSCGGALIIAVIVFFLWKQKFASDTNKEIERKRKRKQKPASDGVREKSKRSPKKKEKDIIKVKKEVKEVKEGRAETPKKKRRRFTSSESSSLELDSEEEREIRRQAKLKAKKKEIEWEEKMRLKRKMSKQRKKEKHNKKDSKELNSEDSSEKSSTSDSNEKSENKQKRKRDGKGKRKTSGFSSRDERKKSPKSKDDNSSSSKENVKQHDESLSTSSTS